MRGEWNGLQALFLKDCPYAYYIHYLAHQLQLVITDLLCRALQQKSQDILNAMHLVSTTKMLIQKLRSDGWESLLENVRSFCERHTILIPDMNAPYFDVLKSLRRQGKHKQMVIMEHHYRVEIFTAVIDQRLQELNNRFSEQMTELLILSASLNLRDASTATSERAFSAMKIVKTSLRNRMEDEFLRDYLIVYIEKEIAETISAEDIIDSFYLIKERRAHLK
ncbi:uncharacterized protein LOC141700217 [Apium graveolens]|uniref:uncharacterized protein LOC141700217 n=1 Tax=Apium graveolens TaxID=4045 RepID=UPI003D7AFCAD